MYLDFRALVLFGICPVKCPGVAEAHHAMNVIGVFTFGYSNIRF